jgi:hypothetical protein
VPRETAPEGQLVVLMQIRSGGATMFNARLLKTHMKHCFRYRDRAPAQAARAYLHLQGPRSSREFTPTGL